MTRETPTRMDDQRHANTRDLRGHVILGGKTHAHIKPESALRSQAHRSGEMGHTPVRAPGRASVGRRLQCE